MWKSRSSANRDSDTDQGESSTEVLGLSPITRTSTRTDPTSDWSIDRSDMLATTMLFPFILPVLPILLKWMGFTAITLSWMGNIMSPPTPSLPAVSLLTSSALTADLLIMYAHVQITVVSPAAAFTVSSPAAGEDMTRAGAASCPVQG